MYNTNIMKYLYILFLILIIIFYKYYKSERCKGLIPKILHIIWISDKALPITVKSWSNEFKKEYIDWEVKIWRDEDIERLGLINKREYDNMKQLCGKAQIARYEILYRYGGMYLDADMLWLENRLNPDFFKGSINLTRYPNNDIMNQWFTCVKNHAFLKLVIDEIPKRKIVGESAAKSVGVKLLTDVYNRINDKERYNINFVERIKVLCETVWSGHESDKKYLKKCKKEKKALVFHSHHEKSIPC